MGDTAFATLGPDRHLPDAACADFMEAHAARSDWRPAPIEPSWILAGEPVAQYIPISFGQDGYSSLSLWRCTEGRFRWTFSWEESVYIIKGEVEVAAADGRIARLTAGSVALFQAGTTSIWTVTKPIEKMAHCRRALSPSLSRLLRFARRPWSLAVVTAWCADLLAGLEPALV